MRTNRTDEKEQQASYIWKRRKHFPEYFMGCRHLNIKLGKQSKSKLHANISIANIRVTDAEGSPPRFQNLARMSTLSTLISHGRGSPNSGQARKKTLRKEWTNYLSLVRTSSP